MKVTINTNKTAYIKQKHRGKSIYIFLVYFIWVFSALFLYRMLFTRYGLINNILMINQINIQKKQIKNLAEEYDLLKHKIYLIKIHDTDLLEELAIQLLNRIPPDSKVLVN